MYLTESVSLSEIAYFGLFLASLFVFYQIFDLIYSGIIGYIVAGMLFVSLPTTHLFGGEVGIELLGIYGLAGLVFVGGLSTKLETLKTVGLKALLVAVVGCVGPIAIGFITLYAMKFKVAESFAGGAALASTSVGIALTLMQQQGVLKTSFGSLLTTAAMIDDVISLILISVVNSLPRSVQNDTPMSDNSPISNEPISSSNPPGKVAWLILKPIIASTAAILIGLIMTFVVPKLFTFMERKLSDTSTSAPETEMTRSEQENDRDQSDIIDKDDTFEQEEPLEQSVKLDSENDTAGENLPEPFVKKKATKYDYFVLLSMLIALFGSSILAEWAGASRLLGSFVAGMAFADYPKCHEIWHRKAAKILKVFEAFFFASIGFFLPVNEMFQIKTILLGLILTAGGAAGKLVTGLLVKPLSIYGLAVGVAMIARGELGLLITQQAKLSGVMSQDCFLIVVWAILICTLTPPFFFAVLIKKIKGDILNEGEAETIQDVELAS